MAPICPGYLQRNSQRMRFDALFVEAGVDLSFPRLGLTAGAAMVGKRLSPGNGQRSVSGGNGPRGRIQNGGGLEGERCIMTEEMGRPRCEIYTDVDGVYTADPKIVHNARLIKNISYEEMLELASQGSKVIDPQAVSLAWRYNVVLLIGNALTGKIGTVIGGEAK